MIRSDDTSPSFVVASRRGAALVIELRRPSHANAYTQAMLGEIARYIDAADADASVRAIVVTGAGDSVFCAGADRDEIATRDWRSVLTLESARVFGRLRRSRTVTIAAINGSAVGGGFELALACDLRFAVEHAQFWLPEPELGLLPAAGATTLLPHLVGPLRAKELILGGAVWTAADAMQAGVLTEVVADGQLFERVNAWIARIERRDPDATRLAKQAIDLGVPSETGFDLVAQSLLVQRQRGRDGN